MVLNKYRPTTGLKTVFKFIRTYFELKVGL